MNDANKNNTNYSTWILFWQDSFPVSTTETAQLYVQQ